MILGIDISHWNSVTSWQLLKAQGVEFAFIKASQGDYLVDPLMAAHVAGARAAGILVGLYHYFDPGTPPEPQVTFFLNAIAAVPHSMVALDIETNLTRQEQTVAAGTLSNSARAAAALLRDTLNRYFSWKPALIYTRASFVSDCAPQMAGWLAEYPLWLATWPYKKGVVKCTWDEWRLFWQPKTTTPRLPQGCQEWRFWQFSGDKFVLPGVEGPLDLNYFNSTLSDLYKFLNILPPATTIPSPAGCVSDAPPNIDQRLTALEAAARKAGWIL